MRLSLLAAGLLLTASAAAASESGAFSMSVLVGGAPAPEYASRGRVYVEALKGREFTIRLYNPGPDRAAAALSVDGRNVVDAKRTSARDAVKWILEPGQTIEIPGWQVSGRTARRFFFTDTAGSYAKWLGDTTNAGTVEAVFYRERRPQAEIGPIRPKDEADSRARRDQQGGAGSAPPSAKSAPTQAQASESDRFAATGIGERTDFPVAWTSFDEEERPAARISLRYEFREELVRLGVLPRDRGEDLYARERARGFEPEYAPDPGARR
jgi:hypothetical protein